MLPMATPLIEMPDIMLMTLRKLREKKYRLAMYNDVFKDYFVFHALTINPVPLG